ncbi:MAG: hypothetical protein KUG77_14060, partial [Nannocystaceae bacterium]|nr:hypothetical protein [Nannocystaceae bacterium]
HPGRVRGRQLNTTSGLDGRLKSVHFRGAIPSGNGDVEWSRSDSFAVYATDVGPDADGELVVSGWTELGGGGEGLLYRVDDNGDLVDAPSYLPGRFPIKHAMFGGGVFVVARSNSLAPLGRLQRKNSGFGTLWDQEIWNNDPYTLTNPLDLTAVDGSGVVAVGVGDPTYSSTPWVVRYDGAGTPDWAVETDDFASLGSPYGVALTPEGDVIVAGTREGGPWLARLSADGEVMWSRTLDEDGAFYAVVVSGPLATPVACGAIDGGAEGSNIFLAAYTP